VAVLAVHGLRGTGEHRIGEATDSDRNGCRLSRWIPKDRGETRSAEGERDWKSASVPRWYDREVSMTSVELASKKAATPKGLPVRR
jgi:hypothetical protein